MGWPMESFHSELIWMVTSVAVTVTSWLCTCQLVDVLCSAMCGLGILLGECASLLCLFICYHFLSESEMVSDLCMHPYVPWHENDLFVSLFSQTGRLL